MDFFSDINRSLTTMLNTELPILFYEVSDSPWCPIHHVWPDDAIQKSLVKHRGSSIAKKDDRDILSVSHVLWGWVQMRLVAWSCLAVSEIQ